MTATQISYLTFGIVLILALIFDLGLLSKKNTEVSIKKALYQTIFWVGLAILFCVFLFFEDGSKVATKFFTAYLMEWSLRIDNIFVFILIATLGRVRGPAGELRLALVADTSELACSAVGPRSVRSRPFRSHEQRCVGLRQCAGA